MDYGLPTEQAYHCGASSKDAGKKLCAINVILETSMIHPVIDKLLLAPDKQISSFLGVGLSTEQRYNFVGTMEIT